MQLKSSITVTRERGGYDVGTEDDATVGHVDGEDVDVEVQVTAEVHYDADTDETVVGHVTGGEELTLRELDRAVDALCTAWTEEHPVEECVRPEMCRRHCGVRACA
jgi:hypothetical protein